MDTTFVPAIFESGILRPLAPLDLEEQEQVDIAVVRAAANSEESEDSYVPNIMAEADATVTLEQLHRALAKIPDSLVDDFINQRDERF